MELFKIYFISVRLVDVLDIVIVAFLLYKLYHALRKTQALRVAGMLLSIVALWKLVGVLDFTLLKAILDQIIGMGGVALLVIFSPEIRKFLLNASKNTYLDRLIQRFSAEEIPEGEAHEIVRALGTLRGGNHGALVVLLGVNPHTEELTTGDPLNADVSERLLVSIFQKQSPLHDGAVFIRGNKVLAARCVLPMTESLNLPPELGMRHRAALGLAESSDAMVLILSEERGEISLAVGGMLRRNITDAEVEAAINLFLHKS